MQEEGVSINRRLYTFDDIEEQYAKDKSKNGHCRRKCFANVKCGRHTAKNLMTSVFPVSKVVWNYKLKQYLLLDVLSGLSAGFVHFPQGLAMGLLAGLTPVYGLYTTLFPVLFYVLFGTSQHVSFGTNAVLALLMATILDKEYGDASYEAISLVLNATNTTDIITTVVMNRSSTVAPMADDTQANFLHMKAATAAMASVVAGGLMLVMGVLRLGFLTSYMSTSFIGGFTTAAAFHIATSQVNKLLGINIGSHSGAGKLIKVYIDIFSNIGDTNITSLLTSVVCLVILILVKTCINERFKAKLPFPVPIELLVVVFTTVVSHFANFNNNFNVAVVGVIPTGIPTPVLPDFSSTREHLIDGIVIGILAFAMTISLAKLCCKIHTYTIDDNQELIAYGLCNVLSSFFSSFPSCVGPPRTMVLSSMGAKTTLNGVSTAVLILGILLVLGPLFEALPVCVLAAIIVASMKDLLFQFKILPRLWKINVYDFVIWVVTCSSSILVDLDIGLVAGILTSILTVVIQNQFIESHVIGVPDTEIVFIDQQKRPAVNHTEGIRIFRFNSALYFATAEKFKKHLYEKCFDPEKRTKQNPRTEITEDENHVSSLCKAISFVVLDCSAFNYVDLAGIDILLQVVKEYKAVDVCVYLARCPKLFVKTLTAADFFDAFPRENVFHDIHDAWKSCQAKNIEMPQTDQRSSSPA